MAMDLSKAEPRTANQRRDRLTDNRTAILPNRRDTRMDRFVAAASMSSARRGDGGAEALMRSLGIVKEAAADFQHYADNKFKKDEADSAAQGAIDQASDKVDEEKAERSYGYRNAVALGRVTSAWNDGLREFGDEITGVVEQQDQLTLEERQGEVRQRIEQFYETFALDPETGKLRPLLATTGSMKYLAEQMGIARPQFERAALQRIEQRFNEEALGHFGKSILDQALALQPGQWLDLSNSGALLPATISDSERKAAIINTAKAAAEELKKQGRPEDGWRIYRQLLGVVPATPADDLTTIQSGPQPVDVPASETGTATQRAPKAPAAFDMASYMAANRSAESNGDDTAQATSSSAYGRYQFTKGTWLGLYGAEYGNTGETEAQILAKRAKGDVQDKLMERLTRNNLNALKRAGFAQTPQNAHLAHFLGVKDALRVLRADAGTPIADVVSAPSITANPGVFRNASTAGKLIAWAGRKQGGSGGAGGGAITPDDPVVANPNFRAPDDPLDPIELAEMDFARSPPPSPLLTGNLILTPEERVALTEAGQQYANEVRSDWRRDKREGEDRNFDIMGLRLLGQGERLTSRDVMDAVDRGDIRMEQARPLMEALRQNAAMAEQYQDEREADADRDRAKGREQALERLIAHGTGGMYRNTETPAQARARAIREASKIADPAVRSAFLSAIGTEANRIEEMRANSAPFRQTMARIERDREEWFAKIPPSGVGGNRKQIATLLGNKFDVATKRIAARIEEGEDADAAYADEMRAVAEAYVRLTKPRAVRPQ